MKKVFLLILSILFLNSVAAFGAEKITALTEEWAPYSYEENGKLVGLSVDLVVQILNRAGIEHELSIKPWKRAYNETLKNKNTILFTTSHTDKRKDLFKWVGPLFPRRVVLYRLKKNAHIKVNSFEDLKRYRIGAVRGGAVEELLISKGFKHGINFDEADSGKQNILKLFMGRIELIPGSEISIAHRMKSTPHKLNDMEQVFTLINKGGYYIAVNKETSDELVARIQKAFDSLIAEGARDKIIKEYLVDQD
ncbi:ABC transporter substrate-binding protein [Desulfovibrio sp. JC022]|uniref:substrate-binding periplasmic protein n=1 Tax=Desulfovibrio sp. JC022 TaxID=2593642 RepID=UPI0013D3619B|nr:transporter substrate-binding domain-containing protein [Desulfovibrio sp. JC022]NDV23782.1 amino acid ABC transporter substrate-binding protein [Desulfovibrio sp. JC022]